MSGAEGLSGGRPYEQPPEASRVQARPTGANTLSALQVSVSMDCTAPCAGVIQLINNMETASLIGPPGTGNGVFPRAAEPASCCPY
ncbi:hypothetical protein SKAU_G00035220 [Synaphobranchus kaupii]|uniref:Uncharacterized protein n=1 Tax=Synaphobranchus kaupii TaxID=118154 RepID=A0A9Q1GEM6_SYNKA|nr:hypothetical protein SKAU_G00035220 [Synaphobranchus kaupii]